MSLLKQVARAVTSAFPGPEPASPLSSYRQRAERQLATPSGARTMREVLSAQRLDTHPLTPRRSLIDRQLEEAAAAHEAREWEQEVAVAAKALADAVVANQKEQRAIAAELVAALAKQADCETELQMRLQRALPQAEASQREAEQVAAGLERECSEALAGLNVAEASGDEAAAQAAAERLAQAQANQARAQSSKAQSPAALRASVLSGLVRKAEGELLEAREAVDALRQREAVCLLEATVHESDAAATQLLLATGKMIACIGRLGSTAGHGLNHWRQPVIGVVNLSHVPGAANAIDGFITHLPPRILQRAAKALRPVDFSVFDVDPATVPNDPPSNELPLQSGIPDALVLQDKFQRVQAAA